jgi:hypothetical protein
MAPALGNRAEVEREFLLLTHERKTLGVGLHQPVLDAVVNHLHEVT